MPAPQVINVLQATIDSGAGYSNVVGLLDGYVVGLITPDGWDEPADVSLMVSADGDNFYSLYDSNGLEFSFNIVPTVMINVDPNLLMMAKYIRLHSGRSGNELVQKKTRRFYIVVRTTISATAELPEVSPEV
jgi:hypothetical protein